MLKYISENIRFEMIWADKIQGAYFLFILNTFTWNMEYRGLESHYRTQPQWTLAIEACIQMINVAFGIGHYEKINIADCVENVVKYHCATKKNIRSDDVMKIFGTQRAEMVEIGMWGFFYFNFLKSKQFTEMQEKNEFDIRVVWDSWNLTMKQEEQHDIFRTFSYMSTWGKFECGCI
eukprot:UN12048